MFRIEDNMKKLKALIADLKNFPNEEVKALRKLVDTGMDVKYISKILAVDEPAELLRNIDRVADITEFEKELRLFDMADFVDDLKTADKFDDLFKEIKPLASKLDDVIKLLKPANKITKAIKILSKIPVV